ncbi:MAG: IS66 family insertion sequence element accessory protein TnpA [Terracidiphilus sp.]
MRQRKAEVWAKWGGLVAEQEQSGQSVAAYCRERELRSGQFFAWKKRTSSGPASRRTRAPSPPQAVGPLAETAWGGYASGPFALRISRSLPSSARSLSRLSLPSTICL